jgi:hypothetical protein
LVNKTVDPINLTIRVFDNQGKIEIIGKPYIKVEKEGQGTGSFFVVLPKKTIHNRKTSLVLELYVGKKMVSSTKTNFLGPVGE